MNTSRGFGARLAQAVAFTVIPGLLLAGCSGVGSSEKKTVVVTSTRGQAMPETDQAAGQEPQAKAGAGAKAAAGATNSGNTSDCGIDPANPQLLEAIRQALPADNLQGWQLLNTNFDPCAEASFALANRWAANPRGTSTADNTQTAVFFFHNGQLVDAKTLSGLGNVQYLEGGAKLRVLQQGACPNAAAAVGEAADYQWNGNAFEQFSGQQLGCTTPAETQGIPLDEVAARAGELIQRAEAAGASSQRTSGGDASPAAAANAASRGEILDYLRHNYSPGTFPTLNNDDYEIAPNTWAFKDEADTVACVVRQKDVGLGITCDRIDGGEWTDYAPSDVCEGVEMKGDRATKKITQVVDTAHAGWCVRPAEGKSVVDQVGGKKKLRTMPVKSSLDWEPVSGFTSYPEGLMVGNPAIAGFIGKDQVYLPEYDG